MPAPVMMTIFRDLARVSATFWRRSGASAVIWTVGMFCEVETEAEAEEAGVMLVVLGVARRVCKPKEHVDDRFSKCCNSWWLLQVIGLVLDDVQ